MTRNSDLTLKMISEQLAKHNLRDFEIALSRSFLPTKPHPAPALHIAKAWSADPSELFFVGDGEHDMCCSFEAGTVGVLVRNSKHDAVFVETDLEKKQLHKFAFDDLSGFQSFLMSQIDSSVSY